MAKKITNNGERRGFGLQWHLTAVCDQKCKHCYMYDERTYSNELKHQLTLEQCKKVIDDLVQLCKKLNADPYINFTGGDPLLRKDFFEILAYAKKKGVVSSILGNPFHLTDENLGKLKKNGLRSYQISIDGMKEIHDFYRKPGSFDASIDGIKKLQKTGIRSVVMFSISKANEKDLIPVMQLVDKLGVDAFAFARVCGLGHGKELSKDEFTPQEYRKILMDAYNEAERLKKNGSKTKFNQKDHLYTLLMYELGKLKWEPKDDGVIYGGCSIGCRSMCVLANGLVFACRRFYSPIGKMPEQTVEEVFTSDEMNKYRDAKYENCSKCELFQICRGCPAVAYGKTGAFGSADPQCWKKFD